MNKKFFTFLVSVTIVASLVATVIAADKGIIKRNAIALPRVRVVHAEAEFKGVRTTAEKAVCEDNSALEAESSECSTVGQKVVYTGEISGFVNGKFIASGKVINDRMTGWGYTEGKILIYDSNSKLSYSGKFQCAKQRLPVAIDAEGKIENGMVTEVTEVYPLPIEWLIKGSVDLVGVKINARQKAFLNFDAILTNDGSESTVKGKMDGVLVMKAPILTPVPTTEQVTENAVN